MTTATPIAPLLFVDSYKTSHRELYPEGTTLVYSNWTNRGSRIPSVKKVVHFGLQAFCQKYLVEAWEQFFAADEDFVANEYARVLGSYLAVEPETIDVSHIRALHRLGYLPLRFKGLPEGSLVPLRVPTFTIENTLPEFFWLTNYIETMLSATYWHPSTTATIANEYRKILERWAVETGGFLAAVDFQAHDFSFRGQTSVETAAQSAAGHLISFLGSDTMAVIDYVDRYYPGEDNGLVVASVPATEHSVMCAGMEKRIIEVNVDDFRTESKEVVDELGIFRRAIDKYPSGIVSMVSDSYDLWHVLLSILPTLKDEIMARDGKIVIRPDSGDPVKIICGDPNAPQGSPAWYGVVELLYQVFGGTKNAKGFIELDNHIGTIYGDSITPERADEICRQLAEKGFASTNVVFGVGSFSYQGAVYDAVITRDTFGSAIKATAVVIDGEVRNIQKDPVTDSGMKKSATGFLSVVKDAEGELVLIQEATPEQMEASLLQTVWEDGKATAPQSFADVRAVLASQR